MQTILQRHQPHSLVWQYGLYAPTNFQFHLIARIDDTTQVLTENIRVNDSFPNALKTRLNLSAMNTTLQAFCVLASLSSKISDRYY
jgi:hypothetical protein